MVSIKRWDSVEKTEVLQRLHPAFAYSVGINVGGSVQEGIMFSPPTAHLQSIRTPPPVDSQSRDTVIDRLLGDVHADELFAFSPTFLLFRLYRTHLKACSLKPGHETWWAFFIDFYWFIDLTFGEIHLLKSFRICDTGKGCQTNDFEGKSIYNIFILQMEIRMYFWIGQFWVSS